MVVANSTLLKNNNFDNLNARIGRCLLWDSAHLNCKVLFILVCSIAKAKH
jgi:hypothetical protein